MKKEFFSLSERIKSLREKAGRTQLELATELGVGRTSVSSWEMGFSAPSTAMVVELARVFSVTTDYLLGNECESTVDVSGLSANEVSIVVEVIEGMRGNRKA